MAGLLNLVLLRTVSENEIPVLCSISTADMTQSCRFLKCVAVIASGCPSFKADGWDVSALADSVEAPNPAVVGCCVSPSAGEADFGPSVETACWFTKFTFAVGADFPSCCRDDDDNWGDWLVTLITRNSSLDDSGLLIGSCSSLSDTRLSESELISKLNPAFTDYFIYVPRKCFIVKSVDKQYRRIAPCCTECLSLAIINLCSYSDPNTLYYTRAKFCKALSNCKQVEESPAPRKFVSALEWV